jgi:hypothetical protein
MYICCFYSKRNIADIFYLKTVPSWVWGLMRVILATWEAEIRRIKVQGQPGQIVLKTPFPK